MWREVELSALSGGEQETEISSSTWHFGGLARSRNRPVPLSLSLSLPGRRQDDDNNNACCVRKSCVQQAHVKLPLREPV